MHQHSMVAPMPRTVWDPGAAAAARQASEADRLYTRGQWPEALARYCQAIRLCPHNANYHYRLAYCAWRAGELALVGRHFNLAIRIAPGHGWAQEGLALWLLGRDRLADALRHSDAALAVDPQNADFRVTRAFVLAAGGDVAQAWNWLEPVMHDESVAERAAVLYARIATRLGREQQAIEWVHKRLRAPDPPPPERPRLHYALSALLDRMGRHDEAFAQARRAHELTPMHFDRLQHRAWNEGKIARCTPARLAAAPRATHGSSRPVFIVGMLRSGTSLVEQVLASHPQVFGAGELLELALAAESLQRNGRDVAGPCGECGTETANDLASRYLSAIDSLNASANYVTDKMPLNFLHLDLVQTLFPQCHVIHCVRDPLDTCLSCYMTDFNQPQVFTGNLRDLGSFHRDYQRLMSHWKHVLRLPILEVRYEDMVSDLPAQARRLLEFLGLPWNPRCLDFHQTPRPVLTASREQVRRPIYGSSVGRWKHYENHLAPLIAELAQ